jgi:hypothetical protein
MKLHKETVSPVLWETLSQLMSTPVFDKFCLVGGTALSLQRGHRRSIDIDLFTDVPYGTIPTNEIKDFFEKKFPIHRGAETLDEQSMGYNIILGNGKDLPIKVDLFYTEPFIFDKKEIEGIRLADQREIIAMKMLAIGGPIHRQKDYWDVHEMLSEYGLGEMIEWGLKRNPYSLTREDIIAGFEAIDSVEESPEGIDSLKSEDYWELKVLDLKLEIEKYKKQI